MSEKKEIKAEKCNCIFGRISRFFCRRRKQTPLPDVPLQILLIRHDMLDDPFLQDWLDNEQKSLLSGLIVLVRELPPQIECEGVGLRLCFGGKRLLWQGRLHLQVEHVEKKRVSFQKIDSSTSLVDENFVYSLLDEAYDYYLKLSNAKVIIFPERSALSPVRFRGRNNLI